MTPSALSPRAPALYDISPRTVLRLRGPDRLRFLNGQVTQDVRLATTQHAVFACLLNAKGQLEAVCHIREQGESYLLDAPLALREILMTRLDRYLIADDVELLDESDQWHVAHLTASDPPATISSWNCTRLRQPGRDLFSPAPITVDGVRLLPGEEFEQRRIEDGIPAWGAELLPGLLPPEAGLEAPAISYNKGCYLGQEVISRMKHAGKTNQHLVHLVVSGFVPVPCALLDDRGLEAGRLTSIAARGTEPSTGGLAALGFRRRKFAETSSFRLSDPDGSATEHVATVMARIPTPDPAYRQQ